MTKRDGGRHVDCKSAALWRVASSILAAWTIVAVMGCAGAMQAVSSGLDGAAATIKSACPKPTDACEYALDSYNIADATYNAALVAKSVGAADQSDLETRAAGALVNLYEAIKKLVIDAKPKPPPTAATVSVPITS